MVPVRYNFYMKLKEGRNMSLARLKTVIKYIMREVTRV